MPRGGGGGETHPRTHRWAEPRRTRKTSYTYIYERVRAARERRPRRSNRARGEYNARSAEFLRYGPRKRNHRWGSGWNDQERHGARGAGETQHPGTPRTPALRRRGAAHTHTDARMRDPVTSAGRNSQERNRGGGNARTAGRSKVATENPYGRPYGRLHRRRGEVLGGDLPNTQTVCTQRREPNTHIRLHHPHRPRRTPESMHRITNVRRDTAPRPSGGARVWVADEPPHRRGAGAARRRAREKDAHHARRARRT